ncbi:MAG TPA: polysaccharide biosynthesis/export family protein [Candidatus Limnocylindrales bacterium]|nr:polysaccharide biosynthesis/export family protein [Candidatus Limnocylindrales bacterium]
MKNWIKLVVLFATIFLAVFSDNFWVCAADEYVLGEGDIIEVIVRRNPDLSRDFTIRPDGKITFPLLGDIQASGFTASSLKEYLTKELEKYIQYPDVTVIVKDAKNYKISVLGGGVKSTIVSLQGPTPLLRVLLQLGLDQNANLKDAYIIRNNQRLPVDMYALVMKGDMSQNIIVEPNDTIFIPPIAIGPVNPGIPGSPTGAIVVGPSVQIVGEVKAPQTVPYREGLKILDVILQAGGLTDYASGNKVKVVRRKGDKVEEIKVKVKDILKGDISKNILLQPGDLIVVPKSFF